MKKGLSLVMAAALAAGLLTGCGASGGQEQKVTTEACLLYTSRCV